MPWLPLDGPKTPDAAQPLDKKNRFFVDESLGGEAANWLRVRGYNAVFAGDVGLLGHSDEDVFSYAWRDGRMLLTHDRDFLDDKRFPEHRNPGVVVLPGADGNNEAMTVGMLTAVSVFGRWPETWQKTKSTISPTGEMVIRRRAFDTGKVLSTRYRLNRGRAEIWED
jgi:predicted nuclease of predicted toxin-antitoxin system